MTPERQDKLKFAALKRQLNLALILENVHDPHNIGAVLRSCDSVGVQEVYLLVTDPQINVREIFLSKRTSSGARKWLDVYLFRNLDICLKHVRSKYKSILGTRLDMNSKSLYDYNLKESIAIAFGNEHEGLSDELSAELDGHIEIPQYGMVQSLNISVACAVVLFEALRQRKKVGLYDNQNLDHDRAQLLHQFEVIQEQKIDENYPKLIEK